MKKELYLGGEKSTDEYFAKDFTIYFKQLFKRIFKKEKKRRIKK